jgi:micrococcal nuclease
MAGLLAVGACASPPLAEAARPGEATVLRVIDGDTVEVLIGDHREPVRLIGVDTPEVAHPPDPADCFGPEASAFVQSLLPPGTRVLLSRDEEARDPYDRLLAYLVRAADELDINHALLEHGYAEILSIAPNTTRAVDFARAEADARAADRGLWRAC